MLRARGGSVVAVVLLLIALQSTARAQRPTQGEDESAALVEQARQALREHKLDAAAKAANEAIQLNPRRVEAYVMRAAVFTIRKQYKDGIDLLNKARALAPDDANVLGALGSNLVLSGDYNNGVPLLEKVAAKQPEKYDVQLLLAKYYHDTGKWPDVIKALEAYFAHRPKELASEDPLHQIDLADAYLRYRQPSRALTLFQAAEHGDQKLDLRARIGEAWATAALDCKRARPLLHNLEPVAEQHPEVWLVDGQCALATGDAAGALALGRRYLAKVSVGSAAGHALVGDALASRGNLVDARNELETAHRLEPTRRRWSVRLAFVLRRQNKLAEALEVLNAAGTPTAPAIDSDWWLELGETLLAKGDALGVVQRLGPIVADLPNDAQIRTVLGAALLATNSPEPAVKPLEEAETIQSSPRSRKLLALALTAVAAGKLSTGDAAGAEPMLARADQLEETAATARDLGIAKLQLAKITEALPPLDRAVKLDTSPVTLMLDARAHAVSGDMAGARPLYERALGSERDNAIEIALDWAASELAGGDPTIAVTALEKTQGQAKSGPLAARHKAALAEARHAAGVAQLRAGNGPKAVELLRASEAIDNAVATRCDLAIAEVVAGDTTGALNTLHTIGNASCPFPPPADTQAAPILAAFTEGLTPRRAGKSLERLTALGGKATGAAAALLGTAIRVVALNAAQDAYRSGQLGEARKYLSTARSANARVGTDEIATDLAVLDLVENRVDAAIGQLERLAGKVPEALVDLGLAYEKKGDQAKALDAWHRAKKIGVRFGPLDAWIDSKERIYGAQP
jgi:tetratricopeptide (TPR) repeat protein